ncbi:23S rRNA (adenine(2503)-C(2))-methyltransferase RlmN [Desulfarculus baarsii]
MSDMAQKPDLRDLTAEQLARLLADLGEKPFRARQVSQWLHGHGVDDIAEMTSLSKTLRAKLSAVGRLTAMGPAKVLQSADGTRKLLFLLEDGQAIESVLMPEDGHHTLCVSTQVGCRQGCRFCATASLGLRRNLRPAEILGQVLAARRLCDEFRPLTNLVFMGMGEPLDNLDNVIVALGHILGEHGLQMSQRRVTVSTVGLVDRLPLLAAASPCALAISLNAPNEHIRRQIMPVTKRFGLEALRRAIVDYPLKPTRRVTLEYVLLGGVNDRPEHARELARWAKGLPVKVNLIAFNPHQAGPFQAPEAAAVEEFQNVLIEGHVTALLRRSRGQDIAAACGQLVAGQSADGAPGQPLTGPQASA